MSPEEIDERRRRCGPEDPGRRVRSPAAILGLVGLWGARRDARRRRSRRPAVARLVVAPRRNRRRRVKHCLARMNACTSKLAPSAREQAVAEMAKKRATWEAASSGPARDALKGTCQAEMGTMPIVCGPIGIWACDTYLLKMEVCIAKMDPAARSTTETSFKETRAAWQAAVRSGANIGLLQQGCEAAVAAIHRRADEPAAEAHHDDDLVEARMNKRMFAVVIASCGRSAAVATRRAAAERLRPPARSASRRVTTTSPRWKPVSSR